MKNDIRWIQRLQNYEYAFAQLKSAVEESQKRELSELEKQGIIQAFEYTHELAWNVLKDYFTDQGNTLITGSKDATREAFNKGLIVNGSIWMEMIKSRNLTSHTYNKSVSEKIYKQITTQYFVEFVNFKQKMDELKARTHG